MAMACSTGPHDNAEVLQRRSASYGGGAFLNEFFNNGRRCAVRHVLQSQQFELPLLKTLFGRADDFSVALESASERRGLANILTGRMLFTLFYEPSTRTRFSFEAAARHLGMGVVSTENARDFSSAVKGETLEDTIRILNGYYPDVIILRHFEAGAAERAAAVSRVPIVNAGDGTGQHPTQALLDLYTILREKGRVENLTVVIGGDLAHGRTARSLAYLLGKFENVEIVFVAPPELRIGEDIKDYLCRHGVRFQEEDALFPALGQADVVYWTRTQKERMAAETYAAIANRFTIGPAELGQMRKDATILHPLPRVNEIAPEVDSDPRAAYFRQAANGLPIRMALLSWVLDEL